MTSDFQQSSSTQGREFEDAVVFLLKASGWRIIDQHFKAEGAEVDIVASDPRGQEWWIECKGSHRGTVPGSKRGDTVKKAVGVAWYLSTLEDAKPYMLVTSHMPTVGTLGDRMLDAAKEAGLFADIRVIGFTQGFDVVEDIGDTE